MEYLHKNIILDIWLLSNFLLKSKKWFSNVFSFLFFCTLSLYCCIFDEELVGFSGYKILTFFCYIHMVSFLYHHSFSFEMVDMRKEESLQGINHLYNGSLLASYIQYQYQEVIHVMFNQQMFMFSNESTLL